MILRKCLISLVIFALLFGGTALAADSTEVAGWQQIAPGIEYQKYQLSDPNNVFVVRMDRSNPSVTLESTIATGKLTEGRETVSQMYNRYDQALNFWGGAWGMRNQAVVAINGSYFDYSNGLPQGGQVQDGWYAKRYDNLGGWSGFSWKLDRSAFIGECVSNPPGEQLITDARTGMTLWITNVNIPRGTDEIILYTPQYNTRTGTGNTGLEVVVELKRPTLIIPAPNYASGYVRQVRENQGNSWIPFNSIVLSAVGAPAQTLKANVQVGDEIRISQEIAAYVSDCSRADALDWTKTYSAVQGAFFFLKDGEIRDFNDPGAISRNPRTAIAYNAQYVYFIVVDGRDSQHSVGMSIHDLALFTRDTLGATRGVAQDGGGSSTLVINGQVVNNTFCNQYVCSNYAYYIPVVNKNSTSTQSVQQVQVDMIRTEAGLERLIANGMVMVITQPGAYSQTFLTGDQVSTRYAVDLRLGPGTNYEAFSSLSSGTSGTVVNQMNGLNGVQAKSSYWWYVNFGGAVGWLPEEALTH